MAGLPPEVQFCIDSMVELHEISGDIADYFKYEKENATEFFDNGGSASDIIRDDYVRWRRNASREKKAFYTFCGLSSVKHVWTDYCMAVTNDAIAMKKGRPTKKELLWSLTHGTVQERFIRNLDTMYENCMTDFKRVDDTLIAAIRRMRGEQQEIWHRLFDIPFMHKEIITAATKRKEREKRKRIKKSVTLMEQFFGEQKTRMFLGENHIQIDGKNFNFLLENHGLSHMGHGGMRVKVRDKANEQLGDLCFYYENMPVADQIIAFMLDVTNGNEDEILKVGNLSSITEAGFEHRHLAKLKKTKKMKKLKRSVNDDGCVDFELMDDYFRRIYPEHDNVKKYHESTMKIVKLMVADMLQPKMDAIMTMTNGLFDRPLIT